MGKSKLDIIVTATDNASGPLRGIGDEVSSIQKQLATQAFQNVQFAAGNVLRQTGAMAGEYIKAAGDAQLVSAQLDAQLKAMGDSAAMTRDEMTSLGDEMSKVTMFDDEAVISAESVLLRFTSIGHDVFPEATRAAADLAQTMGTDMTSAAGMLGRALEDPIQGMSALRRAKIVFTSAEEASIKAMAKAGNVAGAQALMLKALEGRIGGAAEAAGNTFPGQVKIMENSIENFKETVGGWFIEFFMALPEPIRKVGLAFGIVGPQVAGMGGALVQFGLALLQLKAAGGITTLLSIASGATAATAPLTGLAAAEGAAATGAIALTLPLALLALAIGALVAVVVINFDTLKTEFIQVATVIGAVVDRISFEIDRLMEKLGPVGSALVKGTAKGLYSAVNPAYGMYQGMSSVASAVGPSAAPITVNAVYSPGMSLGNKAEFQAEFIPLVISAMRQVNRGSL